MLSTLNLLLSHRASSRAARHCAGYDVSVVTPEDPDVGAILAAGFDLHPISLIPAHESLADIKTFYDLFVLFRRLKPKIVP